MKNREWWDEHTLRETRYCRSDINTDLEITVKYVNRWKMLYEIVRNIIADFLKCNVSFPFNVCRSINPITALIIPLIDSLNVFNT